MVENICLKIEDEGVYFKHNEMEQDTNARFHSQPIYDDKYIKTKVKTISGMINTHFSDNKIFKEGNHYICIAAICIDSILKMDKKNYPRVCLEQCKFKIKRRKMVDFIDTKVDLSSDGSDD